MCIKVIYGKGPSGSPQPNCSPHYCPTQQATFIRLTLTTNMDHDTKTSEQLAHVESHMPADEKRAQAESDYSDVDPVLEKQLLKKIDRRLLPVLWVMYIFNYIDRVSQPFGGCSLGVLTNADEHRCESLYWVIVTRLG